MFDKPEANHTLGLELDGSLLKGAQMSLVKGIPTLDHFFHIDLKNPRVPTELVNPFDIGDEGAKLRKSTQDCLTVTSLDSDEILIRSLDIKLKKERDIDAVLAFQAEPLLPFPLENAILERIPISQNDDGTLLTVLAARKDHIQQHLERWNNWQIDPEVVSSIPVSLALFSKFVVESQDPHFVLHLGNAWTTCVLVKEGKLLAAQSSHIGLDSIFEAFSQDNTSYSPEISTLDFSAITQDSHPHLYAALDTWQRAIARLLSALSKQSKTFEVSDILVTGEGVILGNIASKISQKAKKKLIEFPVPAGFNTSATEIASYAIPIGSALSALPPSQGQINFRQQELAYPHPWRRLKKTIALYLSLCLFLAIAFYLFGNAYIGKQEDLLRQDFVNLLSSMNKSYPAFETEYERKTGLISANNEGIIKAEALTPTEISERLSYLQKDLKEGPDSFPLQPNVPRVSDVLAWLSTHPNIAGAKENKPEELSPLLQIDSFSYSMVKRPELKKKLEKYQVKVEIEFTAPTAKLAREFHDALIAPNELVDPKGEVKWNANKGKYRASFFLKDKTVYTGP
jgi:type IV pilus assembly protein PilM